MCERVDAWINIEEKEGEAKSGVRMQFSTHSNLSFLISYPLDEFATD